MFNVGIKKFLFFTIYLEISIKILHTTSDHETVYDGNSNSLLNLTLLFNGPYDSGHFDIFDYENSDIQKELKKFYNKKANILKRKNENKMKEKVLEKKLKLIKIFDISKHNSINNFKNINYLGAMTFKCLHCSAKFWKFEKRKSNCCQNGKIRLSPLSEYDKYLKNLLLYDNDFRNLIRYYNNLFCFASFNANVIHDQKKQYII